MAAGARRAGIATVLSLVVAACGSMTPSDGSAGIDGSATPGFSSARPTIIPVPGHETYGFVPYWEMDESIADHLATVELTTLALFSVTHQRDGSLDDTQNGWRRIDGPIGRAMIDGAKERGTRVELVYTSFGAAKNRQFYADPDAQAAWIAVLVDIVKEHGFDGVNVDVEALPPELVIDYGGFVGRLRTALRVARPDAQV
ncbi:MAG: hypothetical protein ACRDIL_03520, partial [Candidatus Limnocylindrales bacterium]